ncbi:fusaric acid resistance protein region [Segniliparus rotundus DSM 44985]|uniref:Fusaric acid resistance protein region n=1 Tax=Segniliparus rotundus (strain ATCC BAA-972 / CDC 1076 / CIP 108378 / DSM 44985 / JCM 13578) TaxID=640132 RepID=D6Z9C8_SEGRD|nr:hypothetical protein [Segniliparus rotundus]ADG98558.1 fusaric acid resistance protein region [Segniliparus rotundus DSM 44985]
MIERVFTPDVRRALYALWIAIGPLLVAYGVSLPGGPGVWDQVVFVLLGIGNTGTGALAYKHLLSSTAELCVAPAPVPAGQGGQGARDSLEALRDLLGGAAPKAKAAAPREH